MIIIFKISFVMSVTALIVGLFYCLVYFSDLDPYDRNVKKESLKLLSSLIIFPLLFAFWFISIPLTPFVWYKYGDKIRSLTKRK